jgi:hypothetical protein
LKNGNRLYLGRLREHVERGYLNETIVAGQSLGIAGKRGWITRCINNARRRPPLAGSMATAKRRLDHMIGSWALVHGSVSFGMFLFLLR